MDPISHLIEARNRDAIIPEEILLAGTKENRKWYGMRKACWMDIFYSIGQNNNFFYPVNLGYSLRKGENGPEGNLYIIRVTT